MRADDALDLFPTTRERWRAAFHPPMPTPTFVEESDLFKMGSSLERWRAETEPLRRELSHLDPAGRALLLEVRRYTYKPGVTFRIRHPLDLWGMHRLIVAMLVQDSRDPWKESVVPGEQKPNMTSVRSTQQIPSYIVGGSQSPEQREQDFAEWFRQAVTHVELHEADEWIRRDDVMLFDPHAPK